jgi:hypothetical protein
MKHLGIVIPEACLVDTMTNSTNQQAGDANKGKNSNKDSGDEQGKNAKPSSKPEGGQGTGSGGMRSKR